MGLIKQEIGPDTEVILLQVLHPLKTQVMGGHRILVSQREEVELLAIYFENTKRRYEELKYQG